ncbi:MAG: hypothetical protein AAGJ35_07640, partial [Myxococcota bacterium]
EQCVNPKSNAQHCGGCRLRCRSKVCVEGRCVLHADNVFADARRTCTVLQGQLKCWGDNLYRNVDYPRWYRIRSPPNYFIDIQGQSVKQILSQKGSGLRTCVRTPKGLVFCWNNRGHDVRSGPIEKMSFSSRVHHLTADNYRVCGLTEHGEVQCLESDSTKNPTSVYLFGRKAMDLASGFGSSCVVLKEGPVQCWGDNSRGQLGYGDFTVRQKPDGRSVRLHGRKAIQLAMGDGVTCALFEGGKVTCWGKNLDGELGLGLDPQSVPKLNRPLTHHVDLSNVRVQFVASHSHHVCVLLADGGIKCWGSNRHGQLGYPDLKSRNKPEFNALDFQGKKALQISCGGDHTCAVLEDHSVRCWGYNSSGELGHGHRHPLLKPIFEPPMR